MAYTEIDRPDLYFNTKLYTGNGSTQSINGIGFQPDWVWQKTRNYDYSHTLADVVRGASLNMFTNNTLADQTVTNGLTSFDSDGFSVGADLGWNASAGDRNSKVAWAWKAGGTASSNVDGSITSTVSANTTSGFSIVSYTGTGSNATVGHGLGVTPKMMIVKQRTGTENWTVYHVSIGNPAQYMELNSTGVVLTNSLVWNSTNPTSSVFSVGTNARTNGNGSDYIAYCFAEKKGFSKFGSYTGNGNADGTFVYTGFKPSLVIIKNITTSGEHWHMGDNKRDTDNAISKWLLANASGTEFTIDICDFVSNGFKIRTGSQGTNQSGASFIYMCFAENPFVTSTGIPTTAR